MQVLFHLGAHHTDEGLLLRSILKNRGTLAKQNILVPGPSRYRDLIETVSQRLTGSEANTDTEDILLEAIGDPAHAERVVLSNENFLGPQEAALSDEGLYPLAERSSWLRKCLPSHDVEFALALRNPVTLVPRLLRAKPTPPWNNLFPSLKTLSWLDVIVEIITLNPDTPLIIWCHEDTPFIWSELMQELTAHDPATHMEGTDDMLEQTMSAAGLAKLKHFLQSQGHTTRSQRAHAIGAFLEAHAIQDLEEVVEVPGWTAETVEHVTARYDEDVAVISKFANVTLVRA